MNYGRQPSELDITVGKSYPFLLDCKENLPPALAPKSHAPVNQQPLATPPTILETGNVLPVVLASANDTQRTRASRKPLPFASTAATTMGQAQALASVLVQPAAAVDQSLQQDIFLLPALSWTDSNSLWQKMRSKDSCKPAPEADLHLRHPCILPSMRTILLDWMLEVRLIIHSMIECLDTICMVSNYRFSACQTNYNTVQ